MFDVEEIESDENNVNSKENITERLAAARQTKFNHLWNELLEKISQLNQVCTKNKQKIELSSSPS